MKRSNNLKPIAWERRGSCIVSTGHKLSPLGYVHVNRLNRRTLLHRLVCERRNGPLGKLHALHSCDNPACINPEHLRPGTQADNMRDKVLRGRSRMGPPPIVRRGMEKGAQAKLTDDDVRKIRVASGKQTDIAAIYGVYPSVISRIKSRKAWKHVDQQQKAGVSK